MRRRSTFGTVGSLLWFLMTAQYSVSAFTTPNQTHQKSLSSSLYAFHEPLEGAMTALNEFYRTEPFLAAFLTCSAKASAADLAGNVVKAVKVVISTLFDHGGDGRSHG